MFHDCLFKIVSLLRTTRYLESGVRKFIKMQEIIYNTNFFLGGFYQLQPIDENHAFGSSIVGQKNTENDGKGLHLFAVQLNRL